MKIKTPITLITGPLGSGKTTLLKRILAKTDRRLAILMNEFGEIAIDSKIIKGENVNIVELAGGCVCCSLTGELEAAVKEIIDKIDPDLIILEATGVAEADALVYVIEDILPQVRIDSVICIVDAYASVIYPSIGYASRTQLSNADIILINKMDLIEVEDVERIEARVKDYNSKAFIIRTVQCDAEPDLLFGEVPKRMHMPMKNQTHGHKSRFQSFVYTTDAVIQKGEFLDLVQSLPQSVYRAKGFVRLKDGAHLFNYVAGRYDLEGFESEGTRLVFIGIGLEGSKEELLDKLRGCESSK